MSCLRLLLKNPWETPSEDNYCEQKITMVIFWYTRPCRSTTQVWVTLALPGKDKLCSEGNGPVYILTSRARLFRPGPHTILSDSMLFNFPNQRAVTWYLCDFIVHFLGHQWGWPLFHAFGSHLWHFLNVKGLWKVFICLSTWLIVCFLKELKSFFISFRCMCLWVYVLWHYSHSQCALMFLFWMFFDEQVYFI